MCGAGVSRASHTPSNTRISRTAPPSSARKASAYSALSNAANASATLDYEATTGHTHNLTISIDSDAGTAKTANVTVNVTNINEAPAFVADRYNATLDATTTTGGSVISIPADDVDADDTLTYTITAGNNARLFNIDNNGNITLAVPTAITRPTDTHNLTVQVSDGTLTDTATVNITDTANRGTVGTDSITGTTGRDVIYGNGGSDTISGDSDRDIIYGGAGGDTIAGGEDNDIIYGEAGTDTLRGGEGNDTLHGGTEDDTIYGGNGTFIDTLFGDEGNDTLYGDDGNDMLYGGDNNDELNGGDDNDTLYGDAGADTLYGDAGTDILYGGAGDDELRGGREDDHLFGGIDNDTLYGGNGNDTLYGGAGVDFLYGKRGNDEFDLDITSMHHGSNTDEINGDVVVDFSRGGYFGIDVIRIDTVLGNEKSFEALNLRTEEVAHRDYTGHTTGANNTSEMDTVIYHTRGTNASDATADDIVLMILEDFTGLTFAMVDVV